MRQELVKRSFREDASMAGAIFMSNTATRELCFRSNIFGLPIEYQPFVRNIRQGMPLFLFDHTERKLYGVFEATSDGGFNIIRSAFSSIGCSYPAQVCFKIIWKCRPLTEDEFSPAIKENYYMPWKFYFDLSYQQVVCLYQLFDEKRVEHPIHNHSKSANLENDPFRKGTQERKSLSPNIPHFPADQPGLFMPASTPRFSTVEASYCASTSMHQAPHPNMSMPLGTNPFGVQIAPVHNSHHDQAELPYNNNMLFPGYLPSGHVARDTTQELGLSANHSYPPSMGYAYGCLPPPGHRPQDAIAGDVNYAPPYPQFPLPNEQGSATNRRDYYDVHCKQCQFEDIYESEHQHFSKAKVLAPPILNQQDVPVYPAIAESAFDQRKECFTEEDSENARQKQSFNHTDMVFSGLGNSNRAYMPDHLNKNPDIRSESNTIAVGQHAQSSVFSRLSRIPPPLHQEIPGPSLNKLVLSLSQRAEHWGNQDKIITNDVCEQLVSEQVMDTPYPLAELNQQSGLIEEEIEGLPFMNFKRRSETRNLDANLGKEIRGQVKRRKLVRPSFGEVNNAGSSGKELEAKVLEGEKHSNDEHDENKFSIDLNKPAAIDGDVAKEDDTTTALPHPSVAIKMHKEKPSEENMSKPNSPNTTEEMKKQDPSLDSATHTEKISLELDVADLNTIDQSKLQAILSSSLLQALDKLRREKLNNSEEAEEVKITA
uniref:DCD domain-containing protein n=1 Tax=Oryza meridionalis TaxID=40149 RepID=A0A0E0EV13_9ORYZ